MFKTALGCGHFFGKKGFLVSKAAGHLIDVARRRAHFLPGTGLIIVASSPRDGFLRNAFLNAPVGKACAGRGVREDVVENADSF